MSKSDIRERRMQIALGVFKPTHCDICGEKFKSHPPGAWKSRNRKTVIYVHTDCYVHNVLDPLAPDKILYRKIRIE